VRQRWYHDIEEEVVSREVHASSNVGVMLRAKCLKAFKFVIRGISDHSAIPAQALARGGVGNSRSTSELSTSRDAGEEAHRQRWPTPAR